MGGYCNVLTDPFCGELLGAIQKAAKEQGRYIVYDVPETEEDILRLCAPWNIDGAIVLGWKPEECARLAKKTGKPTAPGISPRSAPGSGGCFRADGR